MVNPRFNNTVYRSSRDRPKPDPKADLLFISDWICELFRETRNIFLSAKSRSGAISLSVLIGSEATEPVRQFSDKVFSLPNKAQRRRRSANIGRNFSDLKQPERQHSGATTMTRNRQLMRILARHCWIDRATIPRAFQKMTGCADSPQPSDDFGTGEFTRARIPRCQKSSRRQQRYVIGLTD